MDKLKENYNDFEDIKAINYFSDGNYAPEN